MSARARSINSFTAWCGIIWFVFIIDASFTWFLSYNQRDFIGSLFVFFATYLLHRHHLLRRTRLRMTLFISVAALFIFMLLFHGAYITGPFIFIPLMCFVLWSRDILIKMYVLFRKFIVFYAILSIVVEILVLTGVWEYLPYITLPPQDTVQEHLDLTNYFYGFFSISIDSNVDFIIYRASGPLREGGHFAVFLGFVYFIEKVIYAKRSIWLIICGILTLSPNFIVFLLVAEVYCVKSKKKFLKILFFITILLISLVILFIFSPDNIKDEIFRIVIARTLAGSLDNFDSDGFMSFLDGRANSIGLHMYNKFVYNASFYEHLFGFDYTKLSEDFVLSDIRYLIIHYGYVGFSLFILCTFFFSLERKISLFGFSLFILAFWVMLQRAWMFDQVYIWVMMFLATNVRSMSLRCKR